MSNTNNYAGIFKRFVAALIDGIILIIFRLSLLDVPLKIYLILAQLCILF